ncbi:MAG: DNA polymerase III subunit gamma/tau [Burkholderiaceae bacterium]
MSYQVLARKWRPRNFETLVGQEHVVRALRHALDEQRLHHAWLFTGTRGVGKTTLSRILAKCLNCIGADGHGDITSKPCGICQPCTEIDGGRFVDYIEMDAASNRGVDEMAQLLEQAIYAPSNARFKVYMIDEVHMLTSHAFNAMLKTLEEPPEHVKFILATTDPQKIPVTVLSRCLQFNLKQMPLADIAGHLGYVLEQEGIAFERPALRLLGRAAAGSMRDALSLTDQAIAYSAGQVGEDAVRSMLGALDQTYLLRILDALADGDGPTLMTVVDEIASRSLSFGNALLELGGLLHRIAMIQMVPARASADDGEIGDADDTHLKTLAGRLSADDVQLYYQITAHGRRDLVLAPDETTGFSMTLLRMLAFRIDDGSVVKPVPRREAAVSRSQLEPAQVAPAPVRPIAPRVEAGPVPVQLRAGPPVGAPAAAVAAPVPAPVAAPTESAIPNAPLPIDSWVEVVGNLKLTGLTRELVQQTELVSHDERSILLRVPKKTLLGSGASLEKFKAALAQYFGRPVGVTIEVGAVKGATVAAVRSDERAARQADAQAIIDADPFVQAVVRDFGGASVVPGSVKPV